MFCYGYAGAGNNKSRSRRNVESFRRARSGSRGIDEKLVMAAHWNRAIPHGLGHAREFLDCFAFDGQDSQCRGQLGVRGGWIKQRVEKIRRFRSRKIFSAHQTQCRLTKFKISDVACPSCDLIHSRWRREQPNRSRRLPLIPLRIHFSRSHGDFICFAIASAFAIARALFTVSSYSRRGFESATIPAPA